MHVDAPALACVRACRCGCVRVCVVAGGALLTRVYLNGWHADSRVHGPQLGFFSIRPTNLTRVRVEMEIIPSMLCSSARSAVIKLFVFREVQDPITRLALAGTGYQDT